MRPLHRRLDRIICFSTEVLELQLEFQSSISLIRQPKPWLNLAVVDDDEPRNEPRRNASSSDDERPVEENSSDDDSKY
jgi:hypothetical protein